MKLGDQVAAARDLARVRLLGRRIPIAVRLNLNHGCHLRCRYCSFWSTPSDELDTATWLAAIRDLAALGTRRLSFSGGEPMLRRDLGSLIEHAADFGIGTELNSTGHLFRDRRAALGRLELVKLSLDGSEAVHDRLRGRAGAFRELLDATDVLRGLGVKYSFTFTMTRENLDQIEFALDFAQRHDTFVAFQPVMAHQHASARAAELYPEPEDWARAVALLAREKLRRPDALRNSTQGLRHIAAWPEISGLACWAGDAFVVIEANGDVVPCDRIGYDAPVPSLKHQGVEGALGQLPEKHCDGCGFAGSVEINLLMAGRVDAVPGVLRVVRRRR